MELIRGPWKNLFKGNWDGYEIEVKENPEKEILTLIYEKEKAGAVSLVTRFYHVQGNAHRLTEEFKNYSTIIEKQFPTHKTVFFSISSGPSYSSLELLNQVVEEQFKKIEAEAEDLNEKTRLFSLTLTELKRAGKDVQRELLSDPLLMTSLITGEGKGVEPVRASVKVPLGKTLEGVEKEEDINSFLSTLIIGNEVEVEKAVHVILENAVLAGKIGIVFDYDGSFSKMNYPNRNFDYQKEQQVQPIGLPIKHAEISELGIDLKLLDKKMLAEIFSIDSEGFIAEEAREVMATAFEKNKEEINSLEDLEQKVMMTSDETKKFHVYRAVRWLKVLGKKYPGYFKGETSYRKFIPPYSKSMGSIIRVNVSGEKSMVKKALLYSLVKTMEKDYEKTFSSFQLKSIACLVKGKDYFPTEPVKEIEKELIKTYSKALEKGIGVAAGFESEAEANEFMLDTETIRISFISQSEAAVKERNSRPYRIKLRQNMSS